MTAPAVTTFDALRERYTAILFDAYGVLINAAGAIPQAAAAIAALVRDKQPFLVVTNDASRLPERGAQRYQRLGLDIKPEQVLGSGQLIGPALVARGLERGRVVVLGTGDSSQFARNVGATVVAPSRDDPADALVIADEGGFDTLATMDATLDMVVAACERGRPPLMLLANPDIVYPAGGGRFGFTAGSLAAMLDKALHVVLGDDAPTFDVLGKPSPLHFEEAIRRIGTRDAVMLGDTLHTDIAGAHSVGLDNAIMLTGVTTRAQAMAAVVHRPTYMLDDLRLPP